MRSMSTSRKKWETDLHDFGFEDGAYPSTNLVIASCGLCFKQASDKIHGNLVDMRLRLTQYPEARPT